MMNSVKHCGAKGDGVTDDTEAFRLALMREGEVFVPDGEYVITGALPVSRLCRGITSHKNGGIILARHPEWGYDLMRYFRSAVIVPPTIKYRLKCAAIQWAIKLCAKAGRIPDWLHNKREQALAVTYFGVSHLTVIGPEPVRFPGVGFGGVRPEAWDKHLSFSVHNNHFMTDEWRQRHAVTEAGQ
jgi:hypothetical protein